MSGQQFKTKRYLIYCDVRLRKAANPNVPEAGSRYKVRFMTIQLLSNPHIYWPWLNSNVNIGVLVSVGACSLFLTIRKSQDTDDQEEGNNHNETDSQIVVWVVIIPVDAQQPVLTKGGLCPHPHTHTHTHTQHLYHIATGSRWKSSSLTVISWRKQL